MKKLFLKSTILIAIAFAVLSFVKLIPEGTTYSCDPKINDWVIKNKPKFAEISRAELAKLESLPKQLGLYRSLSPNAKSRVWIEKIDHLLSKENFNLEEKEYLEELRSKLIPEIFEIEKSRNDFLSYFSKWSNDAKSKLNWTDDKIFYYTNTWLTQEEIQLLIQSNKAKSKTSNLLPDCMCRSNWWCFALQQGYCEGSGCNDVGGCGIFGMEQCIGICMPPI